MTHVESANDIVHLHNDYLEHSKVWDDPKLLGDNGEVPIFEWSGWRFDSRCEIFSLLDGNN